MSVETFLDKMTKLLKHKHKDDVARYQKFILQKKTEITVEKEQKESTAKDALDDYNVFLTNKLLILTINTGR